MISSRHLLAPSHNLLGFPNQQNLHSHPIKEKKKNTRASKYQWFPSNNRRGGSLRVRPICGSLLPVDPWSPNIDSQSIASQLFAASLFPYLGFLYFITKSKSSPKLTLFGFYFLLAFVGATIPAGIYAKVRYGTSLSNVDWLHGSAEALLTLTNLFIVLGLMGALRKAEDTETNAVEIVPEAEEEKSSV
ncbi:hypothetical protein QJS04_geneDACA008159 [Acorus gramineus]|uniref:Uncharacterized protein n=1 Tax=Acorus gramineus TaxID=55184 RepID=A0AAV9AYP1_ACOGR|nr:hypothetical protein QJS04_geneDACA008159 [Acorus gramineus]